AGESGGGACATGGVSRIGGTGENAPLCIITTRIAAAAAAISITTAITPTISSGTTGEDRLGGGWPGGGGHAGGGGGVDGGGANVIVGACSEPGVDGIREAVVGQLGEARQRERVDGAGGERGV